MDCTGNRLAVVLAAVLVAVPVAEAGGQTFDLAITIDDLSWTGGSVSESAIAAGNEAILDALGRRGVEATGFVVCDAVGPHEAILRRWLERGHELGNHSAAHRDLNTADPDAWIADVERCHDRLARLTEPRFFRYPLLHRGATIEARSAAESALRRIGYRSAPVTIDNSEWVLANRYREAAVRGDEALMRGLAHAYIAHMRRATNHARVIGRARLGRELPHVLLVHANRLNADWLGAVLDSLAADGARYVPLDSVLTDTLYALPDDYVGEQGLSWLYRVGPAQPDLALWDDEEEREIRTRVVLADPGLEAIATELAERGREFSATYLRRDAAGVTGFYTEDAIMVLPGGRVIAGRAAIERYWTLGPRVRALEHRLRTERLYGDAARVVEIGRWFATSQRDGAEAGSASGRYVAEWVRGADGAWRMRVDTWHRDDGDQ